MMSKPPPDVRGSYEKLVAAKAHTSGGNGWVYRTATALFAVASFDAANLIEEVSQRQRQPQMLDHLLTAIRARSVAGFGLVFAAGGNLHVMLVGSASLEIQTTRANVRLVPQTAAPLIWPIPSPPAGDQIRWQLTLALDNEAPNTADKAPLDTAESLAQASRVVIELGETVLRPDIETAASVTRGVTPQTPQLASLPFTAQPAVASQQPVATHQPVAQPVATHQPVEQQAVTVQAQSPTTAAAAPNQVDSDEGLVDIPISIDSQSPELSAADTIVFADDLARVAQTSAFEIAANTGVIPLPTQQANKVATTITAVANTEPETVLGLTCEQGHHNNPSAKLCHTCSTDLQTQPIQAYVNGPRPDLGLVLLDDGTSLSLKRSILFGREVHQNPEVASGTVVGVELDDPTFSTSRQHAQVVLDNWSVFIEDLNSSNGTWLQAHGLDDWQRIGHDRQEVGHGDKVRIGSRTLHFLLK